MGAWRDSMKGTAGAVRWTFRRIAARSAGSSRSARERMTAEARRSEPTGSRRSPRGKEPAQPEGIEGIEHDKVEIASQPAMLEPVVKDDQLRFQLARRQSLRA